MFGILEDSSVVVGNELRLVSRRHVLGAAQDGERLFCVRYSDEDQPDEWVSEKRIPPVVIAEFEQDEN